MLCACIHFSIEPYQKISICQTENKVVKHAKHLPPTGKTCQYKDSTEFNSSVASGLRDAAASSKLLDTDQAYLGGQRLQREILAQLQKVSQ